jgi:ABC-type Fe3+-hydroxamate transport system substrate-binding protein
VTGKPSIVAVRYIVAGVATMIAGVVRKSMTSVMKWLGCRSRACGSSASSTEPVRVFLALVAFLFTLWGGALAGSVARAAQAEGSDNSIRLVSLNPSLTAIVIRLGAAHTLVGVDDYSARLLPELAHLPSVGGLFDPGLESIVSLRPDRVLLVGGVDQQTHAARLEKLGLEVEIYRNERLDEVLENIERLGRLLGRESAAKARIRAILEMREAVAATTTRRKRPRTVAIVDRSPLYLVGAATFLDELLHSVGAENIGRQLSDGYPRASIEWLISSRPELILDLTPGATPAADFWSRWPSIPAVAKGRIVDVDPTHISIPGPDLDRALKELAVAVHGREIEAEIARVLAARRTQGVSHESPSNPLGSVVPARFVQSGEESTRGTRRLFGFRYRGWCACVERSRAGWASFR